MSAYTVTFTHSRRPIPPLDVPADVELVDAIHAHVWPSVLGAEVVVLLNEFSNSGRVVSGPRTVAYFTVDLAELGGAA